MITDGEKPFESVLKKLRKIKKQEQKKQETGNYISKENKQNQYLK